MSSPAESQSVRHSRPSPTDVLQGAYCADCTQLGDSLQDSQQALKQQRVCRDCTLARAFRQASMSLAVQMLDSISTHLSAHKLASDEWVASVYADCAEQLGRISGIAEQLGHNISIAGFGGSLVPAILYIAVSNLCDTVRTQSKRDAGYKAVRAAQGSLGSTLC